MTLQDAMSMIRRRRPQAQPIPAFMEFLKQQDVLLQQERAKLSKQQQVQPPQGSQKRRVVGPVGPALPPPTLAANQKDNNHKTADKDNAKDNDDNDNESPTKRLRRVIGPSIGPTTKGPSLTTLTPPRTTTIGPAPPPDASDAIGPQLPPSHHNDTSNSNDTSQNDKQKEHDVGPELPPGFVLDNDANNRDDKDQNQTMTEQKEASIGPSLPATCSEDD
mmetsp:Transcript_5836/g.10127  ORF Transcript_5836/g.10127 Transcript_5836/m.10127 type:complete len:219 (-) Transcript_5836:97-753(-)